MTLNHSSVDRPGEACSHGIFVLLYSSSKGLEFGKITCCDLSKPRVQAISLSFLNPYTESLERDHTPV